MITNSITLIIIGLITEAHGASNPNAKAVDDIPKALAAFALIIFFGSFGGFLF